MFRVVEYTYTPLKDGGQILNNKMIVVYWVNRRIRSLSSVY